MPAAAPTRPGAALRSRVVLVLLVVAGIVLMHGLSASHAVAAGAGSPGHGNHGSARIMPTASTTPEHAMAAAVTSGDADAMAGMEHALCVAVLRHDGATPGPASAVCALATSGSASAPAWAGRNGPAPPRVAPPDPVRELGISRT